MLIFAAMLEGQTARIPKDPDMTTFLIFLSTFAACLSLLCAFRIGRMERSNHRCEHSFGVMDAGELVGEATRRRRGLFYVSRCGKCGEIRSKIVKF